MHVPVAFCIRLRSMVLFLLPGAENKKGFTNSGSAAEVYAGILRQEKLRREQAYREQLRREAERRRQEEIRREQAFQELNGPKLNRKKTKLRLIKSRCCLTAFG